MTNLTSDAARRSMEELHARFESVYASAEALLAENNVDSAIAKVDAFLSKHPDYAYAYPVRALIAGLADPQYSPIDDMRKACDLLPANADFHIGLGRAFMLQNDVDNAVEEYSTAISLGPDDFNSYFHRAVALTAVGKYTEAVSDYDRAIELQPSHGDLYLRRAQCQLILKRYQQAKADLQEFSQRGNPYSGAQGEAVADQLTALANAVRIELGGGLLMTEPDQAIELYDQALPAATAEQFVEIYASLVKFDLTETAVEFYNRGYGKLIAGSFNFLAHCAHLTFLSGCTTDSIPLFEAAYVIEPSNEDVAFNLAAALLLAERWERCEEVLRELIAELPQHTPAICMLAWALSHDGSNDREAAEALELAEKALPLEGHPEDRKMKVVARCQLRVGRIDEAHQTLKQAIEIASEDQLPVLEDMLAEVNQ